MRKSNDLLASVSTLCFWCVMYVFQIFQQVGNAAKAAACLYSLRYKLIM